MCLKYCFLLKSKKKPKTYMENEKPEINQHILDNEDNEDNDNITDNEDNDNITDNEEYYSPYCRRRPLKAQRICINCNRIFYAYKIKSLCSKECSFSHKYSENFN